MLEWLENSQASAWIKNDLWGWPLALTIHALGTALVVGLTLIMALRLLGVFTLLPYTSLRRLFPVIWAALAVQFLSGAVMWMTKPVQYVADGAFVLKMVLIVAGAILTVLLQKLIAREAAAWDENGRVSPRGVNFAAAVMLVWCAVLLAGRLTAQLGTISFG